MRDSPARLLIVEDDDVIREVLVFTLADEGYAVETAADGQAALEQLAVSTPDVILLDMMLPVIDGWEATRQLKAAADTKNIPIIALTAHAMTSDEQKARDAGCDDFDTKPIELSRLLEKIQRLVAPSPASP